MTKDKQESTLEPSLRAVWNRTQRKRFFAGLLALCRWAIPLFLVGMTLDWLAYLPTSGRLAVLIVLVSCSLFQAWRQGWRYLRAYDPTRTALEIEDRLGGLESLLVTAVQFEKDKPKSGGSDSLRQLTRQNAEIEAAKFEVAQIVDFKALRRPVLIFSALVAVMLIFSLNNGPFLAAGLKRIFTPWAQVAYPTDTKIDLGPGELVFKEGDSAEIVIGVSGVVPKHADLLLRTGEASERELEIEIVNGLCRYAIASASRDFSYRIEAGDARSEWRQVRVISPPKIEKAQVDLAYPSYLERPAESVEALTLTVPEDTTIRWQLSLDRPIRNAFVNRDGEEPKRLEVVGSNKLVFEETVDASRGYDFSWIEAEHGFAFVSPRYYLQVASDQPPRVELVKPSSNLIALLGRPLVFAARASDDHGIGSSSIAYRVNSREEKSVALETPLQNGGGEQKIDWDYREALPDLKVDDTVSFLLEVTDKYPDGPQVVRSETRRLTILSKEDYLEQIRKKTDRLLSRVQTTYRQQRAAFESVRNLDSKDEGYLQACQVEAIRQEMLREQLKGIAGQLKDLLDDLAANKVSDEAEGESLEMIRSALVRIADTHLAEAASRLRLQSDVTEGNLKESPDLSPAARAVNEGARDLASLVLLRGIDSAQEVYAREARMLAEVQASLRWRTTLIKSVESGEALSKQQDELARWTRRLIADLQEGMRYDKRPLAVLRLIQSVKNLQRAKTEERMRKAGELIEQGQTDEAGALQSELVTTLLDAEFSVRLSGAYSTLIKTRDRIRSIRKSQAVLREKCSVGTDQDFEESKERFEQDQAKLRKGLITLLVQTVPAPRTKLSDETWPEVPPVRALLKEADRAMADSMKHLSSGRRDETLSNQGKAEQALTRLSGLVDQWSVELGLRTLGLSTLVAVSSNRETFIEGMEAKVVHLWDKTDEAALDEKDVGHLAEDLLLIAEDLNVFNSELLKRGESNEDKDAPPLLSRTKRAEKAMRKGAVSLKANEAEEGIERQGEAADLLAEALLLVSAQNERLDLLQSLLMFQRSVGFAIGYLNDLGSEQRDLMTATEALPSDDPSALLPRLKNQANCVKEVAPLLTMLASRIDTGTPLAFAVSDLEDAALALEDGDKLDSLDAQDVAVDSLEEVNELVLELSSQAGYVSEIVEFLHGSVANVAMLESQQEELALQAEVTLPDDEKYDALEQKQRALLQKTAQEGKVLVSVTGIQTYSKPAKLMDSVLSQLRTIDASAAAAQMWLAKEALAENAESLFAVIRMLHGLPDVEITVRTDPALKRLVDVLAVATDQKILFRDINQADHDPLKGQVAVRLGELTTRCEKLAQAGEAHPMLDSASSQLDAASDALASSDRDALKKHQKAALQSLRHFIIEQALILETAVPPAAAEEGSPEADGEDSDSESEFSAGFLAEFVSGEAPKDQRTGWNVLGDRNRAALNQNFARELPLEYRGLLKNYYERVAK